MNKILHIYNLTKIYQSKNGPFRAVDQISFNASEGEIVGILGPNGSGKTTTIKSIASLISFDAGQIIVNENDNVRDRKKVLYDIGAVLEGDRNIYWRLTPLENMYYFAGLRGISPKRARAKAEYLIESLRLQDIVNKKVRLLSRGMKQKVSIACAFIHNPSLILLDEPTLGLDVEIARSMETWVRKIAKEEKKCVLITSHDMKFIEETCDRVVIIQRGNIIHMGSVEELKTKYYSNKRVTIVLNGNLDEEKISSMKENCDFEIDSHQGKPAIVFAIKQISQTYDIFRYLHHNQIAIDDIYTKEDDLEDIFIDIVNN